MRTQVPDEVVTARAIVGIVQGVRLVLEMSVATAASDRDPEVVAWARGRLAQWWQSISEPELEAMVAMMLRLLSYTDADWDAMAQQSQKVIDDFRGAR